MFQTLVLAIREQILFSCLYFLILHVTLNKANLQSTLWVIHSSDSYTYIGTIQREALGLVNNVSYIYDTYIYTCINSITYSASTDHAPAAVVEKRHQNEANQLYSINITTCGLCVVYSIYTFTQILAICIYIFEMVDIPCMRISCTHIPIH